jgi:hypothetical protein
MPWFWLLRLLSGERFRKASPEEKKWGTACFVTIPVFMVAGVEATASSSFFNRAGGFVLWVCAVIAILVAIVFTHFWAKYVPARISYIVAPLLWVAAVWILLYLSMSSPHAR